MIRDVFHVHRHDVVDSTSSEAARRVRAGTAQHAEVHTAREQTAGRGRLGRPWHSRPGEGLYATLVWFTDARPNGAAATMAAGLAVLDAVRALGLRMARLDWPNDLVVDGAKLAGVLIEALPANGRTALVVGIGLNVGSAAFPRELTDERAVTSLAREGVTTAPELVLEALLPPLAARLDAALDPDRVDSMVDDFAAATGLLGTRVVVRAASGRASASGGTPPRTDGAPSEQVHTGTLRALALDGLELVLDTGPLRIPLEHVRALQHG
jgi:BirA family transcriptional regulator, biotin operon repressor / biotin---[acetyl-CoA-carboxylase] ligase